MPARLYPVNTYALKWSAQSRSAALRRKQTCEEMPPSCPRTYRMKRGCTLPLFHKGNHRVKRNKDRFMWSSGDRGVTGFVGRPLTRKPEVGCEIPAGSYCHRHKVKHRLPKGSRS